MGREFQGVRDLILVLQDLITFPNLSDTYKSIHTFKF